jgi:hypothetical protein
MPWSVIADGATMRLFFQGVFLKMKKPATGEQPNFSDHSMPNIASTSVDPGVALAAAT